MKPQLSRIENYPEVAAKLEQHIRETEGQIVRIKEVLDGLNEDHSSLKDKSMESSDKAEGALKSPSEADVDAMLDAEGKASLDKLKSASGNAFDKAYVTAQLEGHKKLLTIQEDYLKVGQNREHLSVTKLARGQIKEHIDHLDMLKSKVG